VPFRNCASTGLSDRHEKLVELEAVRGVAACIVLIDHCVLAFSPTVHGLIPPAKPWSFFGTPLYALINGSAAVVVFFVLSGFVLTYRAIDNNDAVPLRFAAIKRWPRLVVPVLVVNMISGFLATTQLYSNQPASFASGSLWLGWNFLGNPYPVPPILGAIYEGGIGTFLFGKNYFNSNIWTMSYEFFGSLVVFVLAYIFIAAKRRIFIAVAILVTIAAVCLSPYYLCFVTGIAIAIFRRRLLARIGSQRMRPWKVPLSLVGIVLAFFLFGYQEQIAGTLSPVRFYAFLSPVAALHPTLLRVVLHTLSAVIILVTALSFPHYLRTASAAFLGRLSFSIYLVHIPIICSIGAWLYLFVLPKLGDVAAATSAILISVIVTFLTALPLANLDRLWVAKLRTLMKSTVGNI
jgi:peptidoglycan/LPS O-acetylase OafA/YrhL